MDPAETNEALQRRCEEQSQEIYALKKLIADREREQLEKDKKYKWQESQAAFERRGRNESRVFFTGLCASSSLLYVNPYSPLYCDSLEVALFLGVLTGFATMLVYALIRDLREKRAQIRANQLF